MAWGPTNEGETPLDSREGLRDRSIRTRAELNAAEARSVAIAASKYLTTRPRRTSARFDFPWMLKLHKEMFGKVWSWAGTIRNRDLNLGVAWQQVAHELAVLADDLKYWETAWKDDLLMQAVHLHYRAVRIHPFLNGNGRWARILSNIWLRLHDQPVVRWPADLNTETSPVRQEYLEAIRAADSGDIDPLYQLHQRSR